jgi:hypothetical protein
MAKGARRGWHPEHENFKETAFEPYALAIGQLTLAWNDLHERLANLFWGIMGGGFPDRALGIWNSANFDRARREMLKAAARATTPREADEYPKMLEDIKWYVTRRKSLRI